MCLCGIDKKVKTEKSSKELLPILCGLAPASIECPCGECLIARNQSHEVCENLVSVQLAVIVRDANEE